MEWCAKANSSAERRSEGTQRRVESCGQLGERPRVESSLLLWVPGEPLFLLPGMQGPAPRGEIRGNREGRVREGAKDGWGGRTALHSHPDDARPLTGKVRVPCFVLSFTSNRVTPRPAVGQAARLLQNKGSMGSPEDIRACSLLLDRACPILLDYQDYAHQYCVAE